MSRLKVGIIMDNIGNIKPSKDTSFAMLLAAQRKKWDLHYMTQENLLIDRGTPKAHTHRIQVEDNSKDFFTLSAPKVRNLNNFDVLLMRTDPPFNQEYMYSCHILALAEQNGVLVANNPSTLCNFNEKLFIAQFPELCSPTLVSKNAEQIIAFLDEHKDIILKPLDGMGGASIFRLKKGDKNTGVIIETLGNHGSEFIMAQKFIPEISNGDKRILMIDGKPVDYALARIPSQGENRGNLAAGGRGVGQPLSQRDREIASIVGKELKKHGILFAGIDVIGDHLTEINITSPTCVRELDAQFNLDIAGLLMDVIESKVQETLQ